MAIEQFVAEIYDINNEGKKQRPKQMKDNKNGNGVCHSRENIITHSEELW